VHGDLKGVSFPWISSANYYTHYFLQTNVLIDDNGSPLLSDFGRSKVLDKHGFTTGWSGSPRYLAPELLDAPDNASSEEKNNFIPSLTKESDVYAFGMVGLEVCPHLISEVIFLMHIAFLRS
jgi:serine/threonine protein kinase